jgi:hypothetical protein
LDDCRLSKRQQEELLCLAQSYAGDAPGKIPPSAEKDMRMSKRKEKLDQNWKGGRKLIKARHEESASYTEFDVFALGVDGKEVEIIGHGSFEGIELAKVTAMLTQLAGAVGDCEIKWVSFADGTMDDILKWEFRDT